MPMMSSGFEMVIISLKVLPHWKFDRSTFRAMLSSSAFEKKIALPCSCLLVDIFEKGNSIFVPSMNLDRFFNSWASAS